MYEPRVIVPERTYVSATDGSPRDYYFDVPFASAVKHITLDFWGTRFDDSSQVSVVLVEALTREIADEEWSTIGSAVFTKTAAGYDIATTSDTFGALVRVRVRVEDPSTPTTQVGAEFSIRASGKPF